MLRWLSVALALLVIVGTGLVHGTWSGRWRSSAALDDAVARVRQVPTKIGAWQARDVATDQDAFRQAGAEGYWTRLYTRADSRQSFLVILMAGRAGRMAVHTPEVCYRGAGYELLAEPAHLQLPDMGATFWGGKFRKEGDFTSYLRLYWGWNGTGRWEAPGNPRWEFRSLPFLYKLYVAREVIGGESSVKDAARTFLEEFLPAAQATLFPETAAGKRSHEDTSISSAKQETAPGG